MFTKSNLFFFLLSYFLSLRNDWIRPRHDADHEDGARGGSTGADLAAGGFGHGHPPVTAYPGTGGVSSPDSSSVTPLGERFESNFSSGVVSTGPFYQQDRGSKHSLIFRLSFFF